MDTFARSQIDALRRRVEDLEGQVARLSDAAGIPNNVAPAAESTAMEDEIIALVQQGNTIQAIAMYRDRTDSDLASAKAAVDRITDRLRG